MITTKRISADRYLVSINGEPQLIVNQKELEEMNRRELLESLKREMDGLRGEIRVLRTDA